MYMYFFTIVSEKILNNIKILRVDYLWISGGSAVYSSGMVRVQGKLVS